MVSEIKYVEKMHSRILLCVMNSQVQRGQRNVRGKESQAIMISQFLIRLKNEYSFPQK